jgi:two-component system OmpR family response regulator
MSRTVLVVEDDRSTSNFLSEGLREEGFTVEQVADGRDGLYLAATSTYDVIVMDRMLPGLGGLAVAKALRAAGVHTPILMLSSLSRLDERVNGLRAGVDDYLVKPHGFSELHMRLETLMRQHSPRMVKDEPQKSVGTFERAA